MELFKNKSLYMPDMLADGLERGGDNTFAIYQMADGSRREVSYDEIRREAEALVEKLYAAGLKKGDRLGVISAMRPMWYSVLYAALKGGFRMVCIDPGIPRAQIHSMLRQTDVRAVFTSSPSLDLPSMFEGRIPLYTVEEGFPAINGCSAVSPLLDDARPMPEDTFFVLFSSGTTGENRKSVLLPHSTITRGIEYGMSTDAGIYKSCSAYTVRKRDLMLFPPYHVAGLLCAVFDIYCNTQIIMLERLTPNALSSAMQELKPDNICTVPSMLSVLKKKIIAGVSKKKPLKILFNTLLSFSGFCRRRLGWNVGRKLLGFVNKKALGGNLDSFMVGGSACDPDTMRFFLNMGIDVSLAYGLTELGAPLAVTGRGYYPGTTGRVLRHTDAMDIRIVNPDENGKGEVEILSPYRMIGYLKERDMEGCFTEDGYFRSGDIGYFDERDCLVICGRAKEAIVMRNGEKLLPDEVEEHYKDLENVSELSVFKVPDGDFDAFSIAAVSCKDTGIQDDATRRHILDRAAALPPMYRPQEIYMLKELPYSSSHKVQRFRLTEMAVNGFNAPVSDADFIRIDEDGVTAELRELLVNVGGVQWKTAELTEGMLLGLDSLQTMELFVAIQERFGTDLYRLASPPETFGQLLDSVNNYAQADKNSKPELNLSEYPKPVKTSEKILYTGIEKIAKVLWNVHGKGVENIKDDETYLICSNHITVLDPGFICSVLPQRILDRTCIVGKAELVEDKLLKDFVRSHHFIPIDRTGNTLPTLDRCRELLEEGWNILIFPEGTNYETAKEMLPFKEGPARVAVATGVPVIPIHLSGLGKVDMEHKGFLPPLGGKIIVNIGPAVSSEGHSASSLNAAVRSAIEALEPEGFRNEE